MATTWQSERARIAGLSSRPNRPPDDPELLEARRNLRALRLEEHVQKVLEGAPPLSGEQRERIAALLRLGGGPNADHHAEDHLDGHLLVANESGGGLSRSHRDTQS